MTADSLLAVVCAAAYALAMIATFRWWGAWAFALIDPSYRRQRR